MDCMLNNVIGLMLVFLCAATVLRWCKRMSSFVAIVSLQPISRWSGKREVFYVKRDGERVASVKSWHQGEG